jgi:hypothetical protein
MLTVKCVSSAQGPQAASGAAEEFSVCSSMITVRDRDTCGLCGNICIEDRMGLQMLSNLLSLSVLKPLNISVHIQVVQQINFTECSMVRKSMGTPHGDLFSAHVFYEFLLTPSLLQELPIENP